MWAQGASPAWGNHEQDRGSADGAPHWRTRSVKDESAFLQVSSLGFRELRFLLLRGGRRGSREPLGLRAGSAPPWRCDPKQQAGNLCSQVLFSSSGEGLTS